MFNHDDSVNDRAPHSKLNHSDDQTRKLWKDTYDEEFPQAGCMFRGEPPFGELHLVTPDQVMAVSSKMADVTINSVKVQNPIEEMNSHFMLKVHLSNTKEMPRNNSTVLKLRGPQTEWENPTKGITTFKFDTKRHADLQFELIDKRGFWCFSADESYGQLSYPMGSVVDNTPPSGKTVEPSIPLLNGYRSPKKGNGHTHENPDGPVTVSFSASVDAPDKGPCILHLQPGEYGSFTMPENIKQMWGPIPLQRLPNDVANTCIVASHR